MKQNNQETQIKIVFYRLIGPLSTITHLSSYKESQKEYNELLSIIIEWSANYTINKKLSLIDKDDILKVYNKLDKLKDKWLFNINIGDESELADEVVIWMWELMSLRKEEIESEIR